MTDERWRAGWDGPVKVAGIFDGEDYDARAATGWTGDAQAFAKTAMYEADVGAFLGKWMRDMRDMQAANLFALKTGLFASDARRREACETLRASFAAHGGCLQTGFLGTSILLDTLVESGETEMAYDLLLNRKSPGWLAAVDCGATTVWEAWDSCSRRIRTGASARARRRCACRRAS